MTEENTPDPADADAARVATAERITGAIAYTTIAAGTVLLVSPEKVAALLGVSDPTNFRLVGLSDLVIAAGLIFGRPRSRWVLVRAAADLPVGAYFIRLGRARGARIPQVVGAVLLPLALADVKTARDLARGE